jgi:phosphomevalonate kinase
MDQDEFDRITAKWQYQQYKDSCLPTSIKNILDNLNERVLDPKLRFSVKELHNMCKYERGLACPPNVACPSLNAILKKEDHSIELKKERARKIHLKHSKKLLEIRMHLFQSLGCIPIITKNRGY